MADDVALVILGATGDLTSRLVLPALGQLLTNAPDRRIRLFGAGVDAMSDEQWRERVRTAFGENIGSGAGEIVEHTAYVQADITDPAGLATVLARAGSMPVLYFAVPPAVAQAACGALREIDLPEGLVLALEKPFGTDEASARAFNETLRALLPEERIFRIDHFLGRSTLLNVLGVRFANRLLEPVWSADHVESVLIRYDESLGLEGRAGYYDKAGALQDMIQSHLLQVLAFIAMEQPATLTATDLRGAKAAALRATRVWGDDPVGSSRRARYAAGVTAEGPLPAYALEPGVDPSRETETLAEATFEVRTARWAGVPFTLRSGKALPRREAEIVVRFRPVRHLPDGFVGEAPGSVLRFTLGPDLISLELNINGGENPFELSRDTLVAGLGDGALQPYAEVLAGILDHDPTLAVRADSAEQCWRIVQPVIDAWRSGEVPLDEYPAGTDGPPAWPGRQ